MPRDTHHPATRPDAPEGYPVYQGASSTYSGAQGVEGACRAHGDTRIVTHLIGGGPMVEFQVWSQL